MPHRSASGVLSILLVSLFAAPDATAQPVVDAPYLQQRAVTSLLTDSAPRVESRLPIAPPMPPGVLTDVYALAPSGAAAIGTDEGLQEWRDGRWSRIALRNADEGWDPRTIVALAYDARGRLWFASSQGVGVREDAGWRFIDPARGLPVLGLTSLAAAPDGSMWVGSTRGAIRIADDAIEYRQGTRWLPDDHVRSVFVDPAGTAWFVTRAGVGGIASTPTTLADKAAAYEGAIDQHHRRTPYGFVIEAHLTRPGDPSSVTTRDSDNDGLWTSMYGAGECFAWAATRSEAARQRARRAFEALRFLVDVTRGGTHAPPDGFPARSILPTSGRDPNTTDNATRDRAAQQRDTFWKVMTPRWPRSADHQWFWKSDTSSDELDGHYFFYALYHDLVARDDAERAEVAAVVRRITDHLLRHNYTLVDHDGTPTRWAVFGPDALNRSLRWGDERGLNSLSMLTYLRIAHHVTRDARYDAVARDLVARHGYAVNLLYPKYTLGVGGGNQSDDEMAFMNYYHLLKYEPDPVVRATAARSLHAYWQLERPERNPFFNLVAAVSLNGLTYRTAFDEEALTLPVEQWRDDTLDTLRRFPIDLVEHAQQNSHRLDIVALPTHVRPDARAPVGVRRTDGKVLPVDERTVFHWNVDPFVLDHAGQRRRLADGTSFLLPYYMALHHGVIAH
ncbi:MAG TPA: hypothetical protein VMF13_03885 [Luteitalea sp.]|nr:hypothetical protein [Luteitalea sp.]